MIGKTILTAEITLNPSLRKRGTCVPLLFVSRRSPLSAGEKGIGDEFKTDKETLDDQTNNLTPQNS
jgi:hypothetical protein